MHLCFCHIVLCLCNSYMCLGIYIYAKGYFYRSFQLCWQSIIWKDWQPTKCPILFTCALCCDFGHIRYQNSYGLAYFLVCVSVRWPVCLLFTTKITKLRRPVPQLLSFLIEFLFQGYISFTSPSLSPSSLSVFQRVLGYPITVKIKKYFILHCFCFLFSLYLHLSDFFWRVSSFQAWKKNLCCVSWETHL